MALIQNFPNNHIDDNNVSNATGYSSQKIESEFNYLIWNGTHAEWEALPASEQEKYEYVFFTDDEPSIIDDSAPSSSTTYSSEKIEEMYGSVELYSTMPALADLLTMPVDTLFKTTGFYTDRDGHGGYYYVTESSSRARGGLKLNTESPIRYLVAVADEHGTALDMLDVCRYGVREFGVNTINLDTITVANTYAEINSDIISRITDVDHGAYLQFPAGKFFFKDTISLSPSASNYSIRGTGSPNGTSDAQYKGYGQSTAGTALYFPFLTNEQVAISLSTGSIEDLTIYGNEHTYNFDIDRTKTITAPNEVVSETIAVVNNAQVKCTAIKKTAQGWIKNVVVYAFYTGVSTDSANIYIENVYARKCHFGVSVKNDTKIIGCYGVSVHTLLVIGGSITTAHSVRVDSCVNAVKLTKGNRIALVDVDGDYCTDALVLVGMDGTATEVTRATLLALTGRCNTLKSYDHTQSTSPDVRTLADTSGYGLIRVDQNATFINNYIECSAIGELNPFDSSSNYFTPNILLTFANGSGRIIDNQFVVNDFGTLVTADDVLKVVQTKSSLTARITSASDIFYINGTSAKNVGEIDDVEAANNKVYSSEKTAELVDEKLDANIATISGGGENLVDFTASRYNFKPDATVDVSTWDDGTTKNGYYATNCWSYTPGEKIKFRIDNMPSYFRAYYYNAAGYYRGGSGTYTLDDDGYPYVTATNNTYAYIRLVFGETNATNFETLVAGRYEGFGEEKVVIEDLYLSDNNVEMAKTRLGITTDILSGKKWAVAGDSFTAGDFTGVTEPTIPSGKYVGQLAVYPYLIGNRCNVVIQDLSKGGRTLALAEGGTSSTNSFINYYQTIAADADYLTIYFGINDSHQSIPIGTISDSVTSSFYGAWNTILSWLITNRPQLHIGIIVSNGCDSDDYRIATIAIAQKYGIPYIDMNGDSRTPCMIRSTNANIDSSIRNQRTSNWRVSSTNGHPNAECHAFEATFIEEFLRTL